MDSIQRVDLPAGLDPEGIEILFGVDQGLDGQYGQTLLIRRGEELCALHRSSTFGPYALSPMAAGSAPRLVAGRWGSHELLLHGAGGEHRLGLSHGEREKALPILERLYRQGDHHAELAELLTGRLAIERDAAVRRELRSELGRLADELGDGAAACAHWEQMLTERSDDEEALARLLGLVDGSEVGQRAARFLDELYRGARRWQPLVSLLGKRARLGSPHDVALFLEAVDLCRRELGDPTQALGLAGEALAVDPTRSDLLELVDELAAASGAWTIAASSYRAAERATEEPELDAIFLERIGQALRRAGDRDAAIAAYLELTWMAPERVAAYLALDELYAEAGAGEKRVEVLERLVALAASDAERVAPTRTLAAVHVELGALEAALAAEQRILAWAPGDGQALEGISTLLRRLERFSELCAVLRQRAAAALNVDLRTRLLREAAVLAEEALGEGVAASELWRQVVSLRPHDLEALAELGRLLEKQERWEPLLAVLEPRIELETGAAAVACAAAAADVALARLDDPARAVALYERVLALSPEDRQALEATSILYARLGKHELERTALERLLASGTLGETEQRPWAMTRARLLSGPLADAEEALAAWSELLGASPDDDEALAGALAACEALGRLEVALGLLEARLGRVGDGPERLGLLARKAELETAAGRGEAALASWRAILARDPTSPRAFAGARELGRQLEAWETLLELYRERGDVAPAEAVPCAVEAARVAHEQLAERELALELLCGALGLEPERDAELLEAIGALAGKGDGWRYAFDALDERLGVLPRGRRRALRKRLDRLVAQLNEPHRDPGERVALWMRVAQHYEEARKSPRAALGWYRRALELRPRSAELEAEVRRLLARLELHEELGVHLRRELARAGLAAEVRRRLERQLADVYDHLALPEEAARIRRRLLRRPALLMLLGAVALALAFLYLR